MENFALNVTTIIFCSAVSLKTSVNYKIMLNVTINVRTTVTLTEAKVAFSIPKTNTDVY